MHWSCKISFGFVGGSCNTRIKKEIHVGFWMVHVILALKLKNNFRICGWVIQYLHQKGNMGWFLGGSFCTNIKKEKKTIGLCAVGAILAFGKKNMYLQWKRKINKGKRKKCNLEGKFEGNKRWKKRGRKNKRTKENHSK